MKYLVTGGLGFIGSHFIEEILEDSATELVVNVDCCSYAANLDFKPNDPRYSFVRGDIADTAALEKQVQPPFDAVINFASHSHVDNSLDDPSAFLNNNVVGFFKFLELCSLWHRHDKLGKFIHISTDEVFGDVEDSIYKYFIEKSDLIPSSPYSASKASQEMFIHAVRKMFNLKANILRFCNNYGPRQHQEKFVPVVINKILKGESVPVYGDGLQSREWIFVKDAVKRITMVLNKKSDFNDYCIGSNETETNLNIIKTINNLTGTPKSARIEFVKDRVGHGQSL